jgi:hypothetical protein
MAIVDDPQDRKTANSPPRVRETVERIDGDIAGMAGPNRRMPIVMCCTVIKRGDVAEHYLGDVDWRSVRVAQIVTWPDKWADKGGKARVLWESWDDARMEGESGHDGGKAAVDFYLANKAEMTAGMSVSWDQRFDAKRGQPDALYSAMLDYHVMGEEAFAAERQNAPIVHGVTIYELTPDVILSRADSSRPAGAVPDWARLRVAATDINPSYGLTWGALGFGADQIWSMRTVSHSPLSSRMTVT